jgi:hypothetical protein
MDPQAVFGFQIGHWFAQHLGAILVVFLTGHTVLITASNKRQEISDLGYPLAYLFWAFRMFSLDDFKLPHWTSVIPYVTVLYFVCDWVAKIIKKRSLNWSLCVGMILFTWVYWLASESHYQSMDN